MRGRSTAARALVTGGGGFIGSNLVDRLLSEGWSVVVVDDFRTGRREFLEQARSCPGFELVESDVLDSDRLCDVMSGVDWVFHLQANADVRRGLDHPTRDLHQNTVATSTVLEAMRRTGTHRILFSSTGSVYGEPAVFPTPEDVAFPVQTSLYGASKLAGEGLLSAYAAGYGFTSVICRFVSILGERYTHGHVFDFYCALKASPARLRVLGDGRQEKSYLYVKDCVEAMMTLVTVHDNAPGACVYNLGTEETVVVDESVGIIANHMGLDPKIEHTGGRRGWVGDSPLIQLDVSKLKAHGWRPRVEIAEAVRRTLNWFDENPFAWTERVDKLIAGQEEA